MSPQALFDDMVSQGDVVLDLLDLLDLALQHLRLGASLIADPQGLHHRRGESGLGQPGR